MYKSKLWFSLVGCGERERVQQTQCDVVEAAKTHQQTISDQSKNGDRE